MNQEFTAMIKYILKIWKKFKYDACKKFRSKPKNHDDWGAFFNNMGEMDNSKVLFKGLRVKLHPDKFVNDDSRKKKANELYNELLQNQYDFEKLLEIEKKVKNELGL